ncbi:MAG: acetoacetate--CoA ligase, partial [Hyphomicrobiales bacterium]
MIDRPLWTPPEVRRQNSNLASFIERLRKGDCPALETYRDAHAYSVAEPAHFWSALWDFAEIKAAERGSSIFVP